MAFVGVVGVLLVLAAGAKFVRNNTKFTAADLVAVSSSEGCFSVRMPGQMSKTTENGAPGTGVRVHSLKSELKLKKCGFMVAYYDLPEGVREADLGDEIYQLLTMEFQGLVEAIPNPKQRKGEIEELEFQDQPAVQGVVTSKKENRKITIRVVMREQSRVYILLYEAWHDSYDPAIEKAFFDSFEMDGDLPE
ncbi:MAG: hypothetical protein JKY65_31225 [Planctomycetes bacterium]|nr:hypothetical protein [Planctomycetota bacterium]